jgi:hypothetical protein
LPNKLPDLADALRGHFGRELLRFAEERTVAIHWENENAELLPRNASAFVVRTTKALFGVTAKHVATELKESPSHSKMVRLTGPHNNTLQGIDLCSRLISQGRHCDIATFRIQPNELAELRVETAPWPPVIPQIGKPVLVAGFPDIGKRFTSNRNVNFGLYNISTEANSVSERDISMLRPPDSDVVDVLGKGLPPRGIELGGLSGGPVISVLQGEESRIISYALAGSIYESQPNLEIIKAVRADLIDEDGRIDD